MSIANYKRPKLTNPYTPLYSPISIHSSNKINIKKRSNINTRSVSFFSPKRRINSLQIMNRSLSVSEREEPHNNKITNNSNHADPSSDESLPPHSTQDPNSSILDIFQSAKKNLIGGWKHQYNDDKPKKLKRYNDKGYLFVTNKLRKFNPEGDNYISEYPNNNNNNNETPDNSMFKETPLSLSKDPFGWNKWETSDIGKKSTINGQDVENYGTTFIRRSKRLLNRRRENINNTQLIRQGYSDEVTYLRQLYNGEYEIPKIIADEKERQLRLIDEDKKQTRAWAENESKKKNNQLVRHNSTSSFKKSIVDLTDKIKHVLLNQNNKQPPQLTSKATEPNDDVIFIKEKKQTSLQKKRQKYLDDSERFNKELLRLQNEFKHYRQLIEERRLIKDKAKKEREAAKRKEQKLVPIISDKDLSLVNSTLQRKDNAVLLNRDNIEVAIRDFKTLAPRRWLNDTIIEFFMKYVEWNTPQTVAFNSFFYSNLSQRGYQGVRRWMKKKKVEIKDLKKIFTPINLNESHWALGLIDIERKRIVYVDSLSRGPSKMSLAILNNLKDYVLEESKHTMGEDFELIHGNCPQQPNGFDCGIFVCLNALYLSKNSELTFNGKDAANMRNYIAHLILSG